MPDLRAFLVRIALDDAFRDLVARDPDAAFEGYALDEAQKAALRRPDEGWLALLGGVVRGSAPQVHTPTASTPQAPALAEARLLLTLRPAELPSGRLGWGASLYGWPSEADPDALRFVVRIAPRGEIVDGALRGTFQATIQAAPLPGTPEAAGVPGSPHAGGSSDATARAAAAVRAAGQADRYGRLRDLLALVAEDA